MIEDATSLLRQIQQSARNVDERVIALIQDRQSREADGSDSPTTVAGALPIWRVRAEVNRGPDHPLIGAEELIANLESKAPDHSIRQVNLSSPAYTCVLFFDWASDEFLGSLLIRHRNSVEERARNKNLAAMGIAAPSEEYVPV